MVYSLCYCENCSRNPDSIFHFRDKIKMDATFILQLAVNEVLEKNMIKDENLGDEC